ncbi:DUF4170 domain-containing protein [Temperatibacter marinus]|uniref:DUF4170 domain-containing protein n=1 Tax=Temperatibacter marinus TaxID=1456591 RepID=A0AA52H8T1_9PROT|nr:DUF4170 domain-containing protein [Temperatibacter marinus]WND02436.1 DUF4170 domain-containing protein [Temperatibacter marinus]
MAQLPHLVFGGKVTDPQTLEFEDLNKVDLVGVYGSYDEAVTAWRAVSQANVDDCMTKYVVVHLHKLLEPEAQG